ncbi:hypothetical protein ACGF5C_33290 [Micromonospora sp. NPDC047620]|uniref:hypothetical protein n=1 Tax=Micromonospora sp. NPDC047620 TaxID=3364251 RepID=UPI003715C0F1
MRDDVLDHRRVQFDLVVVLGERDVPVDDVVEQDFKQPRAVRGVVVVRPAERREDDAFAGVPAVITGEPPQYGGGEELSLLVAGRWFLDLRTEHRRDALEQSRPHLAVRAAVRRHRRLVVEHTDERTLGGEHDRPLVSAAVVHQRRLVVTPGAGVGVVGLTAGEDALQDGECLAAVPQHADGRQLGGDVVHSHLGNLRRDSNTVTYL